MRFTLVLPIHNYIPGLEALTYRRSTSICRQRGRCGRIVLLRGCRQFVARHFCLLFGPVSAQEAGLPSGRKLKAGIKRGKSSHWFLTFSRRVPDGIFRKRLAASCLICLEVIFCFLARRSLIHSARPSSSSFSVTGRPGVSFLVSLPRDSLENNLFTSRRLSAISPIYRNSCACGA